MPVAAQVVALSDPSLAALLHNALVNMLHAKGIESLYSHQVCTTHACGQMVVWLKCAYRRRL